MRGMDAILRGTSNRGMSTAHANRATGTCSRNLRDLADALLALARGRQSLRAALYTLPSSCSRLPAHLARALADAVLAPT
jgi:hypothetical protein